MEKSELNEIDHWLSGSSLVSISILGLMINIFLFYLQISKQKSNILLLNLTFSNLAIIIFAFPLSTIAALRRSWIWGNSLCTYYGSVALLFGYSIMITSIMLVLDIFFKFKIENYHAKKDKVRKLMIIFIWINSIFWSVTPLIGWSKISYEPTKLSCTVDMMNPDLGYITYILSVTFFIYLLPILLMIYFRFTQESGLEKGSFHLQSQINKAIWISILFIFEWTPYTIAYLWPIFFDSNSIPLRLSLAGPIFAKTAVVLTPLVFIFGNDLEQNKVKKS